MKVLFIAADSNENSLGRVYALWLLTQALGWESTTIAAKGTQIWKPLIGNEFAESLRLKSRIGYRKSLEIAKSADIIIIGKPREESWTLGMKLAKQSLTSVIVDNDDPDLEFQFDYLSNLQRIKKWVKHPIRRIKYHSIRRHIHEYPCFVSNPILQERYGGCIIPHARNLIPDVPLHESNQPTIGFVGTIRGHKGIEVLREAVSKIHKEGYTVTITAPEPDDAKPWEKWVGETSIDEGKAILAQSDIVVIPSLPRGMSKAQLPAKLMDAMVWGRAICVSDVGPMPWAVGDTGLISKAGVVDELVANLLELKDPQRRTALGNAAISRAKEVFAVEKVAKDFSEYCEKIVAGKK